MGKQVEHLAVKVQACPAQKATDTELYPIVPLAPAVTSHCSIYKAISLAVEPPSPWHWLPTLDQGLTGSRYPTRPDLFFNYPTRPIPKFENDRVAGN